MPMTKRSGHHDRPWSVPKIASEVSSKTGYTFRFTDLGGAVNLATHPTVAGLARTHPGCSATPSARPSGPTGWPRRQPTCPRRHASGDPLAWARPADIRRRE